MKGLENCVDLPHTITSAIAYRVHSRSLMEIPKDKRPPRGIWDKPFRLDAHLDKMYNTKPQKSKEYAEINMGDVE